MYQKISVSIFDDELRMSLDTSGSSENSDSVLNQRANLLKARQIDERRR